MTATDHLPQLATAADVADLLGVSERTVRNWTSKGLDPVGSYLPPGSRTSVSLYSLAEAREFAR